MRDLGVCARARWPGEGYLPGPWIVLLVVGLGGCSAIQQALENASRRPTVRVLSYNIKHGEGMDREVDLERAAAVIRAARPDIVTLQEIDWNTSRTERVDQGPPVSVT